MLTIQPDLERLESSQLTAPTNLSLIHDAGLANYWRARRESNDHATSILQWKKVIANWATVIENDRFWDEWGKQRSEIYKKRVSDKHVASVRERLVAQLTNELAERDKRDTSRASFHLEASLSLELKAIRLIKQVNKHQPDDTNTYYGPLFCELQKVALAKDLFRYEDEHNSLQIILNSFLDTHQPAPAPADLQRQLLIFYSQLGLAQIYLDRFQPELALGSMAELFCLDCQDASAQKGAIKSPLDLLFIPCRDKCTRFDRFNPAYAIRTDGRELYARHAMELCARAYLIQAKKMAFIRPLDVTSLVGYLHEALRVVEPLGIRFLLQGKIGQKILEWAGQLEQDESWDEVISLLTATSEFGENEQSKVILARVYNLRGVKYANNGFLSLALEDLKCAYALNPHLSQVRANLQEVLKGLHQNAQRNQDYERIEECRRQSELINRGEPLAKMQPVSIEPVATHIPRFANPVLFDSHGALRMERFDTSTQQVLERACAVTSALHDTMLRVTTLLFSLITMENGETQRVLRLQGISPEELQSQITILSSAQSFPLSSTESSKDLLKYENLVITVREIFELAWEIAELTQNQITEVHLLSGLLNSGYADKWFKAAGVDVALMREQVGWN